MLKRTLTAEFFGGERTNSYELENEVKDRD